MQGIVFITPADAEYGFRLTGVDQHVVQEEGLHELMLELLQDPENALMVIDERLLTGKNEEIVREIEKQWSGILLALPAPIRTEEEVEDYAVRLMRRAIGYHVRLGV